MLYHFTETTTMASATMALSLGFGFSQLHPSSVRFSRGVQFAPLSKVNNSLRLSSAGCISGFDSLRTQKLSLVAAPRPVRLRSLTIVAAKGYKMKTHKVKTLSLVIVFGGWTSIFAPEVWILSYYCFEYEFVIVVSFCCLHLLLIFQNCGMKLRN